MAEPVVDYKSEYKKASNKRLVTELSKMYRLDQALRGKVVELDREGLPYEAEYEEMRKADRKHTARMQEIVETYGWPTHALVGAVGAEMVFTLVQHADQNLAFQRKCLEAMAPLIATGEVRKLHFAYLTDRVLVNEGKKQRYGSQFMQHENGEWDPKPLEDPENVDLRRAEMDMQPIAEYRVDMEKVYGKRSKAENSGA